MYRWEYDVVWANSTTRDNITAFRFVVGMRQFAKTIDQRDTTELMRDIASWYAATIACCTHTVVVQDKFHPI
jgi:hypothetical protein